MGIYKDLDHDAWLNLFNLFAVEPKIFLQEMFPETFCLPFGGFHDVVIRQIELPDKEIVVILIFRGSGKTSIIAGMALWKILFQGYQYLVFASESGDTARQMLTKPTEFVKLENFRDFFGEVRADKHYEKGKWNENVIEIRNDELKIRAFIEAKGRKEQFAGASVQAGEKTVRPQGYFLDDIENIKTATTWEQVKDQLQWIFKEVRMSLDRVHKKPFIFVVGTTYNPVSTLLELEENRSKVRTIRIPSLLMDEDREISEMLGLQVGNATWEENPEKTAKKLKAELDDIIRRLPKSAVERDAFYAGELLRPFKSTATKFLPENLKTFNRKNLNLSEMNLYILVDSAGGKGGKKTDETGMILAGVNANGDYFFIEPKEEKMSPNQFRKNILYYFKKYNLDKLRENFKMIGIESTMYDFFEQIVREYLSKNSISNIPIRELKSGNISKETRISTLLFPCECGKLNVDEECTDFINKMYTFDAEVPAKHMNALDASAYITREGKAPKFINPEEEERKENEQLWREAMGNEAYFWGFHNVENIVHPSENPEIRKRMKIQEMRMEMFPLAMLDDSLESNFLDMMEIL